MAVHWDKVYEFADSAGQGNDAITFFIIFLSVVFVIVIIFLKYKFSEVISSAIFGKNKNNEASDRTAENINYTKPIVKQSIESTQNPANDSSEYTYCPKCGNKLPPKSEFCVHCGKKLY